MNKRIKQQNESVKRITDAELKQATVEVCEMNSLITHTDPVNRKN